MSHCWTQPLRHCFAMPPPLPRGGLGIPQSFASSPEAPLLGELAGASPTERLDEGRPDRIAFAGLNLSVSADALPPPLPRGGFGSPRKVNGFARGSPTRGAVEQSETERLYEGKPDREPLLDSTSPSRLRRATSPTEGRLWHTGKLRLFANGSPSGGAGAKLLRGFDPFPPAPLLP